MTIVDEPAPAQDNPWLGWGVTVAIIVAQISFVAFYFTSSDPEIQRAAAAQGSILWWHQSEGMIGFFAFAAPLISLVLVPGAFGFGYRQLLSSLPRHRWYVVAAIVAVCMAFDVAISLEDVKGGYATNAGVVYLTNGKETSRRAWSEASRLKVSCVMTGKHDDSPSFHYEVTFPGSDPANISFGNTIYSKAAADMPAWLAAVGPIDDALRATPQSGRDGFFTGTVEAECVRRYADALGDAEQPRLMRMLNHAD